MKNDAGRTKSGNPQRRQFLLTAGLGLGGAAAVAVGIKRAASGQFAPPVAAPTAGAGYQASAHVNSYYRSARV